MTFTSSHCLKYSKTLNVSKASVNVVLLCFHHYFQAFYGPFFDGDIGASENLSTPIEARYVRFNPQEPMIQNENHLCMRVDILSCGNGMLPDI